MTLKKSGFLPIHCSSPYGIVFDLESGVVYLPLLIFSSVIRKGRLDCCLSGTVSQPTIGRSKPLRANRQDLTSFVAGSGTTPSFLASSRERTLGLLPGLFELVDLTLSRLFAPCFQELLDPFEATLEPIER